MTAPIRLGWTSESLQHISTTGFRRAVGPRSAKRHAARAADPAPTHHRLGIKPETGTLRAHQDGLPGVRAASRDGSRAGDHGRARQRVATRTPGRSPSKRSASAGCSRLDWQAPRARRAAANGAGSGAFRPAGRRRSRRSRRRRRERTRVSGQAAWERDLEGQARQGGGDSRKGRRRPW